MFKYLSLFLISFMIGATWSGSAFAQQDEATGEPQCCSQRRIDDCTSDSTDACCSGECASDGSDILKRTECCEAAGGRPYNASYGAACCDANGNDLSGTTGKGCCEMMGGIYDDGQQNNVVCCAQDSSKDVQGNYNSRCCTNAGGTSVRNGNAAEYCCKSWSTALKSGSSSPMCTK